MITIEDFKKVEIITATVVEVHEHPNADKLYIVKVEDGSGGRRLVAGLKSCYSPEELVGKRVLVVANLEPVRIRGEESRGMLLAASDGETLSVATLDRKLADGSPVS